MGSVDELLGKLTEDLQNQPGAVSAHRRRKTTGILHITACAVSPSQCAYPNPGKTTSPLPSPTTTTEREPLL